MHLPTLSDLRNWAHSALAVIGFLGFAYGIVTLSLHQSGISIDTAWSPYITTIGGILVAVSKVIDSLNNAISPGAAQTAAAMEQAAKSGGTPAVVAAAPAAVEAPPAAPVFQAVGAPVAAAPKQYPATAGAWPFPQAA